MRGSMTGLPRWAIVVAGLVVALAAMIAVVGLVGLGGLCGLDENQVETGYCAAGSTVRSLVVAIPGVTVVAGYGATVWAARLTPVAVAALCAVVSSLVILRVAA